MKYRNASDILPDALIKEIKKYTSGELLYIPSDESPSKWGQKSGARQYYKERNEAIKRKYYNKVSIDALAEEYGLSYETVRKIVYKS